mgnify:CR=1 FL=1
MSALRVLIAAGMLLMLGGCGEEWFAVVYPNANNKQNSRVLGTFKTLEACRTAIEQEFYEVRLGGAGGPRMAWECHSQCRDRKSTRLNSSHSQQSRMPSSA